MVWTLMSSWRLIDTEIFQRLRRVRALGCAVYVFHNANHTVFEHSLGVAYLARKLIKRLRKTQPELHITAKDVQNVTIAALCHDLGAGPFTNAFYSFVSRLEYNESSHSHRPTWLRTSMAIRLLEALVTSNGLETIVTVDDRRFIAQLLSGEIEALGEKSPFPCYPLEWMGEIVLNKRNMIDTVLFDSINRDTHKLGLFYSSFDSYPLYANAKVIDNEICYPAKARETAMCRMPRWCWNCSIVATT
jgi:HD superfamily phosphohydrolase